jgi:hypothetical protein
MHLYALFRGGEDAVPRFREAVWKGNVSGEFRKDGRKARIVQCRA